MTVNIDIPDGKMQINVDLFLAQANIWKIRRMFKYFKESGIDGSTRYEMDALLQGKLQEAAEKKEYLTVTACKRGLRDAVRMEKRYQKI